MLTLPEVFGGGLKRRSTFVLAAISSQNRASFENTKHDVSSSNPSLMNTVKFANHKARGFWAICPAAQLKETSESWKLKNICQL